MDSEIDFASIRLNSWRQFDQLDLDLSARLTILTGENGTGKTTILSVLGSHFSWSNQLVGTPYRPRGGGISYRAGRGPLRRHIDKNPLPYGDSSYDYSSIGSLTYSGGQQSEIRVPEFDSPEFGVTFTNQQQVAGLYLDSHRITSGYQRVESVPVRFSGASEIMASFMLELFNRRQPGIVSKSPMLLMKEALIAAAIYGEGNSSVSSDPEAATVWTGFQDVLAELFPASLAFRRLRVDSPEVVIETANGDFALEGVSGGLNAIFELAWQIFLRSRESRAFTVCFDEPENHLHPSLQRSILPKLLRAFPRVRFVVATHSPFVVTSSPDARVYVLRRPAEGGVEATVLDLVNQPMSADDTLREVLGVGSTFPIWAEQRLNAILANFSNQPASPEMLLDLKQALSAAGLGEAFPLAAERIVDESEV